MSEQEPEKGRTSDKAIENNTERAPEAVRRDGVISDVQNQQVHDAAFADAHKNDLRPSDPALIAIGDNESLQDYKLRIEQIKANQFQLFDSSAPLPSDKASVSARISENPIQQTGEKSFSLGLNYEVAPDSRTMNQKLLDLMDIATKKLMDPEGQRSFIQGELDKIIGIGEGLKQAKDEAKASVRAGWTALTDGTVANFLAKPNAINDPLFQVVGETLSAFAHNPETVNLALEKLGQTIANASETYSALPEREKGHVIGHAAFAMFNPEGSTEGGELALQAADQIATHVDAVVVDTVQQTLKAIREAAKASPELAQQTKQVLLDYLAGKGLKGTEQLELAGVPRDFFNSMSPSEDALSGNFFAMGGGENVQSMSGHIRLRSTELGERRPPFNWKAEGEHFSSDVVRQSENLSCVSAVGEMLSEGRLSEAVLKEKLGVPGGMLELSAELGDGWVYSETYLNEDIAALCQKGSWSAKLLENAGTPWSKTHHSVVVDGLSPSNRVIIRDPYEGTKYEMELSDFENVWTGVAVHRSIK